MNKEKKLTKNKNLTIRLLFILLVFVIGIGYFFISRQGEHKKEEAAKTENLVTYEKSKLSIFGDKYTLFPDTDKIGAHENYIFVTEPRKQKTTVYDKKQQKKITVLDKSALDYDGRNVLYNKNGVVTYFNNISLGVRCASGYIKSETEILCILPKHDDNLDNILVNINPQDLMTKDVYSSNYTLYYVSYIKNMLYIGGFNLRTKQNYLIVNDRAGESPDSVNVIYENKGKIYFGSFQNEGNRHTENEYQILQTGGNIQTKLKEKGRIVFF